MKNKKGATEISTGTIFTVILSIFLLLILFVLVWNIWNNSNAMCYHILAVILYLADNKFYDRIDKLLLDYKNIQNLKLKMDADIVINDLENLRRIK